MEYISEKQIDAMISSVKNDRDKCLIALVLETGCSITQAASLRWSDIDFAPSRVKVDFHAPMRRHAQTAYVVAGRARLEKLRKLQSLDAPTDYVFRKFRNGQLTNDRVTFTGLSNMIRRAAVKSGVELPRIDALRKAGRMKMQKATLTAGVPAELVRETMWGTGSSYRMMEHLKKLDAEKKE
jgi:integrase